MMISRTHVILCLVIAALADGDSARGGIVKTWGGTGADATPWGMTRDGSSNVYVVGGYTNTVDFNPGSATSNHTSNGNRDAFMSKFRSDGTWLWTKTWGSSNDDRANSVVVFGTNVYVAGCFQDTVDFNPEGGGTLSAPRGTNGFPNNDAYLSKFDSDGTFKWARNWGGNGGDEAYHAEVDGMGNVYVNGDFSSTNMSLTTVGLPGSVTNSGFFDAFIFKFDASGTCLWARCWGGLYYDDCTCSAVDPAGTVYGGGMFASTTADFDPGPATYNLFAHNTSTDIYVRLGLVDVFLTKLDADGNFQWARSWGATNLNDAASGIAVDGADNVYVSGYFQDTNVDFNLTGVASNFSSQGMADAFICKHNSGGTFQWAKTWGGTAWDSAGSVALDGLGSVYVEGTFLSTNVDFDTGSGTDRHSTHGGPDMSLSKFDTDGSFILARTCGGSGNDTGYGGIGVDGSGNVYASGSFVGSVDFGPLIGGAATNPPSYGTSDSFLAQIPTCWKLTVVKSSNGWSSLGDTSPAIQMVSLGVTTQLIYMASDWHRIATLASNGALIGAAAGVRVFTQALANVAADISNDVTFAIATTNQTGYPNVPTLWLTNWAEGAVISDPAFDVHAKYLIGLDPTTLNTFELRIDSFTVSETNAITVLKRTYTGGLSPDGLHGQLALQAADDPGILFTNVAGTAATGATVFDGADTKTYTNTIEGTRRFIRGVIQ
jgi:hypothetical protein